MTSNTTFVFPGRKCVCHAECRSTRQGDFKQTHRTQVWLAEVHGEVRLRVHEPFMKPDPKIPLLVATAVLGLHPRDALERFGSDRRAIDTLTPSVLEAEQSIADHGSADAAMARAMQADDDDLHDCIDRLLLPHSGAAAGRVWYLLHMARCAIDFYLGRRHAEDRDHWAIKRVDAAGDLIGGLLKQLFNRGKRDAEAQLNKMLSNGQSINVGQALKSLHITRGLRQVLQTGEWGVAGVGVGRKGVTHDLNRYSRLATDSHLRRLVSPNQQRETKLTPPRMVHGPQQGRICVAETPEDDKCGLVKNLALGALVTLPSAAEPAMKRLLKLGVRTETTVREREELGMANVMVNGACVGYCENPSNLVHTMRQLKRALVLSPDTSVTLDPSAAEVRVWTDGGRLIRPVAVVRGCETSLTNEWVQHLRMCTRGWNDLIRNGVVELLDADEEECLLVAMEPKDITKEHTHCELHPALQLCIAASSIPYPQCNQSPRNVYQSAMAKQALGKSTTNAHERFDTYSHQLWYPQRPLVSTVQLDEAGHHKTPSGVNCIVAVACFTGFNQEDSLIMNKASVERGLFSCSVSRTLRDEERDYGSHVRDIFCNPGWRVNARRSAASQSEKSGLLNDDGLPTVRQWLQGPGDIAIGKVTCNESEQGSEKDASTVLSSTDSGRVGSVALTRTQHGTRQAKVRIDAMRQPQVGDKFSSRHGQKGTVGLMLPQEDMPFERRTGQVPDLIINPHSIPSRMTIGQLIESVVGKASASDGIVRDGSAFCGYPHETASEELKARGFHGSGKDVLVNGMTGEQMETAVFFGPVYYQRLRHMVADKVHSRARGPRQIVTRQPLEGRSRNGGLRIGEMERDVTLAHGAAQLTKERLMDMSDATTVAVCTKCGILASGHAYHPTAPPVCKMCKSSDSIENAQAPYACSNVFLQELRAMGFDPRIQVGVPGQVE